MSSSYPPFGNASAQPCQRCGMPLPPHKVYCSNCGQYNTPGQFNNSAAQPPSATSWGGVPPSPDYGSNFIGAQQWGQPPFQSNQPLPFDGLSAPQQPFGMPVQPYQPQQPQQPQQPAQPNNFYAAPTQQQNINNPYAAPVQPFNPQPLSGVPASMNGHSSVGFGQPVTGGFSTGANNGYHSTGFAQPTTGGFQPGSMNGYPPAGFAQPPQRKRGPRIGAIIAIVVLLLVVVGGSIGGYEYLKKNNSTAIVRLSPTSVPTTIPKGTPLFSDSFMNNKNNWDTTGQAGQFSVKIGSGSMVLEDDNNKLLWELVPGGRNFNNFYLTTDATLSKGTQDNGYGIYIRGASNQNTDIATYYRFELYGDGTFAVFKGLVDATGTSNGKLIVNYASSSAIAKEGQVNHVAISAKASTMSLIVNGQTLTTVSDNSYTSGSIAMFVSNLQNTTPDAQATFSNFAIYPPQS